MIPRLYTTSPRIQSWYAGRYLRPDQDQRSKPDPGIAGYLPAPRQRRPVPDDLTVIYLDSLRPHNYGVGYPKWRVSWQRVAAVLGEYRLEAAS
jgi:hypothetical protein